MYEVDARGISCPEPVMLTATALKAHGTETVKVSEPFVRDNVQKYAKSQGRTVEAEKKDGEYEILIQAAQNQG